MKFQTAVTRQAHLKLANMILKGDTLSQGSPLLPSLTQAVQRAVNQPMQYAVVAEGLEAACLGGIYVHLSWFQAVVVTM